MSQLTQANDLEWCLDVSTLVKVKSLLCILAITDLAIVISTAGVCIMLQLTYDPLIVIILMTDSNTGALRNAPAGRPIQTTVPRGRTYCTMCQHTQAWETNWTHTSAACWKGFSFTATRMTA